MTQPSPRAPSPDDKPQSMGAPVSPAIISFGLDELHVYQRFKPIGGQDIRTLRDAAMAALRTAGYEIARTRYSRRRTGYVIALGSVDIRITSARSHGIKVLAYLAPLALRRDPGATWSRAEVVLDVVWRALRGDPTGDRPHTCVERLDLFVDLHGWRLSPSLVHHLRYGKTRRDPTSFLVGREQVWSGFQIGAGVMKLLKVYDKTAQLGDRITNAQRAEWKAGGWDGRSQVTRIEVSLSRNELHALGMKTASQVNLNKAWSHVLRKLIRLTRRRRNSAKRKLHPVWELVTDSVVFRAPWGAAPGPRIPPVDHHDSERVFRSMAGLVRTTLVRQLADLAISHPDPYEAAHLALDLVLERAPDLLHDFEAAIVAERLEQGVTGPLIWDLAAVEDRRLRIMVLSPPSQLDPDVAFVTVTESDADRDRVKGPDHLHVEPNEEMAHFERSRNESAGRQGSTKPRAR